MPNLRIVSDNAADRATTTGSAAIGSYVIGNLTSDIKSLVYRVTGTSTTINATWTASETLSCVVLPFCNLLPSAVMRVRGYSDFAGTNLVVDTGSVSACPATQIALRGFTSLQAQSAYAFGGGAYARAYFAPTSVQKITVDIVDSSNTAGYLEFSRLIAGAYWSPTYNADFGAALTMQDTSKNNRTDGGDLITDIGTRNRKLTLNISNMPPADRTTLATLFRASGMANPLFLSLFPSVSDNELERDHQIYGKLTALSAMSIPIVNGYSMPIEIEEI